MVVGAPPIDRFPTSPTALHVLLAQPASTPRRTHLEPLHRAGPKPLAPPPQSGANPPFAKPCDCWAGWNTPVPMILWRMRNPRAGGGWIERKRQRNRWLKTSRRKVEQAAESAARSASRWSWRNMSARTSSRRIGCAVGPWAAARVADSEDLMAGGNVFKCEPHVSLSAGNAMILRFLEGGPDSPSAPCCASVPDAH
jgi:hypothetical protein